MSALLKGMATKKAKNPVYNLSWALDLTYHGDGQSSSLTYNAARISSVLNNPLPAHRAGGNHTFFMNFQPYFMSFDVAVQEDFYTYVRPPRLVVTTARERPCTSAYYASVRLAVRDPVAGTIT